MNKGKPSSSRDSKVNANKAGSSSSGNKLESQTQDTKHINSVMNKAHSQLSKLSKMHENMPERSSTKRTKDCPCIDGKLQADLTGRVEEYKKQQKKKSF